MTIREALRSGEQTLAAVPDPQLDTAALLCRAVRLSRMELLLSAAQTLTNEQEERFRSLLLLRAQRKPLQYILGTQCFYGLDFAVDERVLIPRQETETLCELALAWLAKRRAASEAPLRALDVCTGSGAIAVTLKHEQPSAEVWATDLSADALCVAAQNAQSNGAQVTFRQGDLLEPVRGMRFDLIASNPPYIERAACDMLQAEVRKEPRMALDGGDDGLDFYRRLASEAPDCLNAGGLLLMEIGDTQGEAVAKLLNGTGRFGNVRVHKDLYGLERVVWAEMGAFPT